MADDELIFKQSGDAFEECHKLYEKGDYDECRRQSRQLLEKENVMFYDRILTLLLLGTCCTDQSEGLHYHSRAEWIWRNYRRFFALGEHEALDTCLQTLKDAIDTLKASLEDEYAERRLKDYEDMAEREQRLQECMDEVARDERSAANDEKTKEKDDIAMAEAEEDEPVAFTAADEEAMVARMERLKM